MSIRAKILLLFAVLAIAPILVLGVLDYVHSIQALDQLVRAKVEATSEQAAREIGARHARMVADARLMAEDPSTRTLLRASADVDSRGIDAGIAAMHRFRRDSWPDLRERFASVELVDPWGRLVHRFEDPEPRGAATGCVPAGAVSTITWPVFDERGRVGEVVAVPRSDALLPLHLLEWRFGAGGHSLVVNRETGRVHYSYDCDHVDQPIGAVLAAIGLGAANGPWERLRGAVMGGPDEQHFAAFVPLEQPAWTIVTSADLAEFTAPYARLRGGQLLLVLFVALGAAGAFSILLSGVMRSLRQLGTAADRIGGGDFSPWLPPPTGDEVGRLSMAVALMAHRLRESVRQIQVSRQMAVLGRMAAYLAHEVRNPLSSIRLNLQALMRQTQHGEPPEDLPEVIDLCLKEVKRLDAAVHGVLTLGRARDGARRPVGVHELLEETLDLMEPKLERRNVVVDVTEMAPSDRVMASSEQIKGVLLNLLINATAAMPAGGRIRIRTRIQDGDRPTLALHVRDEGPGVPEDLREKIFEPFFTTRQNGTGIGLPLSLQVAEEHGGRFYLAESRGPGGAEFVLELPLVAAAAPPAAEQPEPDEGAPAGPRHLTAPTRRGRPYTTAGPADARGTANPDPERKW